MQEASVSSTTSSPHKLMMIITDSRTKEPLKRERCQSHKDDKDTEESCSKHGSHSESRTSHHSKRRTHTCSKATRRRSRSSERRSSRKPRTRRRRHRSHRSRSRSRHYSGSRRPHRRHHRRRYISDTSSSSSSSRSSSESRSPSRHSHHTAASNTSFHTDAPTSRTDHESVASCTKPSPVQTTKLEDNPPMAVAGPSKDVNLLTSTPQKLGASNPAINGLVSLLLNATGSSHPPSGPIRDLLSLTTPNTGSAAPAASANTTRQARRLYIGSIPLGITSETMVAFFNAELRARGLCQSIGEPVVCAQVNSERHFAFIELRSVEETTAALTLDGINCLGSTLRIRRPRDYFPPGTSPSVLPVGHLNANSVFLTGIPTTLSETNLCRLLSSYGTLRSANILKVSSSFIAIHASRYIFPGDISAVLFITRPRITWFLFPLCT